jgi:hypothetical protein
MRLTAMPAYGRDYKSKAAVLADWDAGKDFKLIGGPYINKQDCDQDISIRYNNLRSVMVIKKEGN